MSKVERIHWPQARATHTAEAVTNSSTVKRTSALVMPRRKEKEVKKNTTSMTF